MSGVRVRSGLEGEPGRPPCVSVLMCANRADPWLYVALESILSQTFGDFEIVLVCNGLGSSDLDRVRAWCAGKNIAVIVSQYRSLTNNLNVGLHFCGGRYVARMDADDIAYPERLAVQVRFLDQHQDVGVCGTYHDLIDDSGNPFRIVKYPCEDSRIRRALFVRNPLCHPSVMFRRDVVLRAGGYMGGVHSEDYDLWVRLALEQGTAFANIPQVLLGYRANPTGSARRAAGAYAGVSACQARAFLMSGDPRWLAGSLISAVKRVLWARR